MISTLPLSRAREPAPLARALVGTVASAGGSVVRTSSPLRLDSAMAAWGTWLAAAFISARKASRSPRAKVAETASVRTTAAAAVNSRSTVSASVVACIRNWSSARARAPRCICQMARQARASSGSATAAVSRNSQDPTVGMLPAGLDAVAAAARVDPPPRRDGDGCI